MKDISSVLLGKEVAVKGRKAARAVPNMIAATSAWEAEVSVETEQCTVSLSLTYSYFQV